MYTTQGALQETKSRDSRSRVASRESRDAEEKENASRHARCYVSFFVVVGKGSSASELVEGTGEVVVKGVCAGGTTIG